MTKQITLEEQVDAVDNMIFESKEDEDTIEHVDMPYSEFIDHYKQALLVAEQRGFQRGMDKAAEISRTAHLKDV